MSKVIAFIANGEISHPEIIVPLIQSYDEIIAVDGGSNFCLQHNITPQAIIGDLDSASSMALAAFEKIPRHVFPKDKDETDLEIALKMYDSIDVVKMAVFGGLGGRIDHTLYNLILLSRYPGRVFMESESETLFVMEKKTHLSTKPGQLLSLIPLNGPVSGIVTQGLKWELKGRTLDKDFMGISNVCLTNQVKIESDGGDLLCSLHRTTP